MTAWLHDELGRDEDDSRASASPDKEDRSPEAQARFSLHRSRYGCRGSGPMTDLTEWHISRIGYPAHLPKTPIARVTWRSKLAFDRGHHSGDLLSIRWDSSRGTKRKCHHPAGPWTAFIAEGPAPLPLTTTLVDLAVAVRANDLERWALAADAHPLGQLTDADGVLQALWAAETHPFRLARCLVGPAGTVCVAFVRALRSRVLRERFPCYECGDLHENLMAYKYDRARCLWPQNDVACVGCTDALRAAIGEIRLRWLDPITPKRTPGFARHTWEGAKRANRVY